MNVVPLKFIMPVLVNGDEFVKVPLLILIVPLLLHDAGLIVVVPTPVCFVRVPVFVNVEPLPKKLLPFIVIVPLLTIAPVPPIFPSFQTIAPLMVSVAFRVLPEVVVRVSV